MQWDNPAPGKTIESVDIVPADDGKDWGTPALFAITAGKVVK